MLSNHEFFEMYLQHKTIIRKSFERISRTQFPARSQAEKEDRWSDLLLRIKEREVFEGYEEARGGFEEYLHWSIKSILSHMYSKAARHSRIVVGENAVESHKSDNSDMDAFQNLCDRSCNTKPMQEASDLRQELDALMSPEELEVLKGMVDRDLSGNEIAASLGTYNMAVCRRIKSIREKVQTYVAVKGIA
jgi:predicted DNA-binding protein (UPF0251 family)